MTQVTSPNMDIYYLYYWETAIKACPNGWHLPGNEEWNTLIDFLGGNKVAGGKLKTTIGWSCPNAGAINSSGFNALHAGNRAIGGSFYHLGDDALFWSSTPDGSNRAWKIRHNCQTDSVGFQDCSRFSGRSVRCIKD